MLKKTMIDLSKPKDHPDRRRVVTLTAAEEQNIRTEWAQEEQARAEAAVRKAEMDEMLALRKELLDAQAAGDPPSQSKIARFRELKTKHPEI